MSSPPADRQVNTGQDVAGEGRAAGATRRGLLDRILGRRRNYLIDPAYQIRTALIAVLGMTFVVGVAAGLLHLLRSGQVAPATLAEGPPIARGLSADSGWAAFLVVAGVLLVGAVFVIEILETHKTAGVVLRVSRGLHAVSDGAFSTRISLRKHDNFREMEEAFNASARALCSRAEDELRALAGIEDRIEHLVRALEMGDRAGGEELLRQLRGEFATMRERYQGSLRAAPEVRFQAGGPISGENLVDRYVTSPYYPVKLLGGWPHDEPGGLNESPSTKARALRGFFCPVTQHGASGTRLPIRGRKGEEGRPQWRTVK